MHYNHLTGSKDMRSSWECKKAKAMKPFKLYNKMSNIQGKKSLKQRTITGVIWSAFDSLSGLAVQMICSLVVARLLTPADFGLVGIINVFSVIGLIIIDSGFGQALIRKQDATERDYSSIFYFNLIISTIVYIVLYFVSPAIEEFYGIAGLTKISRVVFLIVPLNAIGLIQNTILTKKVDFKTLGIISFISALLSGLIGIFFAYYLRNVWAIVYQMVSMYFFRTFLLWVVARWRPISNLSIQSIKTMFPYASNLLLTGLFGTIVNNICPLIIGKIYNAAQLGYFSQADKLQKLPSTTSTTIIQRVTFPILVEIQDDNQRLCLAYKNLLSVSVFFISPIMICLMVISQPLFDVILGEKWLVAADYFKILCVTGLLYPIHSLSLNLINIKGKSRLLFYLEVLRKGIFLIIIFISMNFSIEFFIWMQVVYGVIVLFINLYFSGKQIEMGIICQFRSFFPEILIGISATVPVIVLNYLNMFGCNQVAILVSDTVLYSLGYFLLSKFFNRASFRESRLIISKLRK